MTDLSYGWLAFWLEPMEEVAGVQVLEVNSFPHLHAWIRNFKEVPLIKENHPDQTRLLAYFKWLREKFTKPATTWYPSLNFKPKHIYVPDKNKGWNITNKEGRISVNSFNHIKFIFETLYKLHKPFINCQITRFCENKLAKVHNIFSLINDTCRGRNGASFLSNHGCKEIRFWNWKHARWGLGLCIFGISLWQQRFKFTFSV